MLGDLMGMMGKIKETQAKIQKTKDSLDHVCIEEQDANGLLKVRLTANSVITQIHIADSLLTDKVALEASLNLVLNKALAKARKRNEAELGAIAKEGMPQIPGLDTFFK
ncbi:YbaB/EbfC family nucleoid-associated protein [Arenibacter sp. GZD96]|uniref:YbaB/EbfC family nucleoid-associated protein n=1 Tax=Aurantibrevibacter litoralis TaxID=3106030 RepID=UPI002AFE0488|nr:YbaB/EbfC family nucleoid-associated protein [Arenibacter sp. GZD-96]MEA1786296.1 YbaB/EbfC family nucleoid-associated protein [Arenibacter sp. GZD-96]